MNNPKIGMALGHALVVAALVLVPSLWLAPPTVWKQPQFRLLVLGSFVLAYLLSIAFYRITGRSRENQGSFGALQVSAAIFAVLLATLLIAIWPPSGMVVNTYPREALLTSLAIGVAGFTLLHAPRLSGWVKTGLICLLVAFGLAGHAAYHKRLLPRETPPGTLISFVHTPLYQLQLTQHDRWIKHHWRKGGGLAPWGDKYLVATGNGELFAFGERGGGNGLEVSRLPTSVPMNADQFVEGAREIFKDTATNSIESSRFRVADVLTREKGDTMQLWVSHHYWHADRQCFVMRISSLEGTRASIEDPNSKVEWHTIFETTPCLLLNTNHPRGSRFDGLENGGRMALLSDTEMLLTVGDHSFDGVNRPERLAQDSDATYGKIMKIDLVTGSATVFSMGHRNPQGLFIDAAGTVWETEHGPQGGDELNIIRPGGNYGWPLVTYGTDYSRHSWPLNSSQGRHDGFVKPVFAVSPSIGIGNLVGVSGDGFPQWQGDLLVASLKHETLWRFRMEEGRLAFAEQIPVGQRIRDVLMGHDGRVLLWTDESSVIFVEPSSAVTGDALLGQCTSCHGFNPWDASTSLGPNLNGIVGRRVAFRDDFRYSPALDELGGRWTRERLDAFLKDPQAFAPGTTMPFTGIPDSAERASLIDFLVSVPADQ